VLAETLKDAPDRRAWHLAAAVLGSDESVARELDKAAARALDRGAPAVAVAAIERAARLSEDDSIRATRLLQAAKIAFQLGRRDLVIRLVNEVEPIHLTRHEQARRTWITEAFDDGISAGSASSARSLESALAAPCTDGGPTPTWSRGRRPSRSQMDFRSTLRTRGCS